MSRELLLLRHAKTEWENPQGDVARGLLPQGLEEANATGAWFAAQHIEPTCVYCSTARRTQQTWEAVAAAAHWHKLIPQFEPRLYLAELPTLQQLLAEVPATAQQLLLIGHNPGLEQLATFLCDRPMPRNTVGDILATANVVRLRLPDDWHKLGAASGVLRDVFRPQNY